MTERFNVMLPGMEQEFELGIPTIENEDVVFSIVTRESSFNRRKIQIIITCNAQNAEEDYIQMGEVTIDNRTDSYSYGFDFQTDDLGMIHIETEFVGMKTFITVSF